MAIHTDEQLEFILEKFAKVGREFGLISGSGVPKGRVVRIKKKKMLPRRIAQRFFLGTKKWMRKVFSVKS